LGYSISEYSFHILGDVCQAPFGLPNKFITGNFPIFVIVNDFNNDKIMDLALAHLAENYTSVLIGNRNGTFQNPITTFIGIYSRSAWPAIGHPSIRKVRFFVFN
jgi:hypothetical protein